MTKLRPMKMDYLGIAERIHRWLSSWQIRQQCIEARIVGNELHFELEHPADGRIQVTQSLSNDRIFRAYGIALELVEKTEERARLRVYDFGGIFDPVDGFVPGEHYAASHYALLSAILFSENKEARLLEQASRALEFHLQTSKHEYRLANWMYHWDFQNYALIDCYQRLQAEVEEATRAKWQRELKQWRTNHRNKLTNWAAMRAVAYCQRAHLFGGLSDRIKYRWNIRAGLQAMHANGCIDDELNVSRPIQYHVFTACLLHRLYVLSGQDRFAQRFLQSMSFFVPFIDPDGDFNYWGRGQEQIFGYGAAVYALTAAAHMTGEKRYAALAETVGNYLLQFEEEDHFPLVLNAHPDEERIGWYDYHHTTVYNAFLGVWLALAAELEPRLTQAAVPREFPNPPDEDFAFVSNGEFFVAVGKGLPHYSSEVGLTPCHIWTKELGWVYSCPGGATRDSFGQFYSDEDIVKNCFAPIAQSKNGEWLTPKGRSGKLNKLDDSAIECSLDYGPFSVYRTLRITNSELQIADRIEINTDHSYAEFRIFNLPIIVDKFEYELKASGCLLKSEGRRLDIDYQTTAAKLPLEDLETLKTAKGLARVLAVQVPLDAVSKGAQFEISCRLRNLSAKHSPRKAAEVGSEQLTV